MAAIAPAAVASKVSSVLRGLAHRAPQPPAALNSLPASSFLPGSLSLRSPVPAVVQQPVRRLAQVAAQEPTAEQQQQQEGSSSATTSSSSHVPVKKEHAGGGQMQHTRRQPGRALQRRESLSPAFSDLLGPWFPGDRTLHQMLSTVDRLFDDMLQPSSNFALGPAWPGLRGGLQEGPLSVRPPWDVQEDDAAYHMRFDLPGMSKEEVSVKLDRDGVLLISAEHKETEEHGDRWKSRVAKQYRTRLQLPDNIQRDGITAEVNHGVLSVTVPKEQVDQTKYQTVDIPIS